MTLTRRSALIRGGNLIAASAFLGSSAFRALAAEPVTVGFVYFGSRTDFGWNQAHAVAAQKIAGMDNVSLVEQERVPETEECARVMESMIQLDGAKVIFATAFGYWPFAKELAAKYPEVLFIHAGGLWKDGDPENTVGYRGFLEEPHYICGVAAGHMSKTGKLGFVGAKPLYFIFNNANAFIMGARSVNPDITCQVVLTGDWDNPVKEAETVNAMIDQGADVIMSNVDVPKVSVETAERRGVYSCGYHTDLSSLAPKGFLSGAEWNWGKGADFVEAWRKGAEFPNLLRGGFEKDMVALSPIGAAVPDDVKAEMMTLKDGFTDGSFQLYKGPLKDNKGNEVLAEGQVIDNNDAGFKLGVKWLVEGAIGSTGLE